MTIKTEDREYFKAVTLGGYKIEGFKSITKDKEGEEFTLLVDESGVNREGRTIDTDTLELIGTRPFPVNGNKELSKMVRENIDECFNTIKTQMPQEVKDDILEENPDKRGRIPLSDILKYGKEKDLKIYRTLETFLEAVLPEVNTITPAIIIDIFMLVGGRPVREFLGSFSTRFDIDLCRLKTMKKYSEKFYPKSKSEHDLFVLENGFYISNFDFTHGFNVIHQADITNTIDNKHVYLMRGRLEDLDPETLDSLDKDEKCTVDLFKKLIKKHGDYSISAYPISNKEIKVFDKLNDYEIVRTTKSGGGDATLIWEKLNDRVSVGLVVNDSLFVEPLVVSLDGKKYSTYVTGEDIVSLRTREEEITKEIITALGVEVKERYYYTSSDIFKECYKHIKKLDLKTTKLFRLERG